MCNKRPLHQPASSSYCGSTHREPGNPSNHGRAEKAGAYSSLPLFLGLPPPPGTPVPEFIPMPPGSQQCPGTPWRRIPRCTLPLPSVKGRPASCLEGCGEVTAPAWCRRLCSIVVLCQTLADGSVLLPPTPSSSLAAVGAGRALTNPPGFPKASVELTGPSPALVRCCTCPAPAGLSQPRAGSTSQGQALLVLQLCCDQNQISSFFVIVDTRHVLRC